MPATNTSGRHIARPFERASTEFDCAKFFFLVFSRFEFALKASGYAVSTPQGGVAPNWDGFATDFKGRFGPDRTAELRNAISYLEEKPPRKQVLRDGGLRWDDAVPNSGFGSLSWLLVMVRRVRNNLFHGGKVPLNVQAEPARDAHLLNSCLEVLEECLRISDTVREAYESELE